LLELELEEPELELEPELDPELPPELELPPDEPDDPDEPEELLVVEAPADPIGCGGTTVRMSASNLLNTARTRRISLKSS
jgi:hypothetical protein